MAPGSRPTSRPGAGPGRGKPRARSVPRAAVEKKSPTTSSGSPTTPASPEAVSPTAGRRLTSSITTRAIALAVVVLILTISYATSLRIYFAQREEIATTRAEITERENRITDLQGELARWDDPAYVKTQARNRLGWVMPGETGYKVVDRDGKPIGGGAEIRPEKQQTKATQDAWWSKLWGSVEAADKPAPAKVKEEEPPPITVDSTPAPTPTPTPSATPR